MERKAMGRTPRRSLSFLAILVVALPWLAKAGDKPEAWHEVRSPNFTIVTDGGEKTGRRIALHFERIRAIYQTVLPGARTEAAVPIVVIAAKNEKSLKALLPWYWEKKDRARPSGVFQEALGGYYIVLRADAPDSSAYHTLYHEYFHLLTRLNVPGLPSWVNEGLAEFWGACIVRGEDAELGLSNPYLMRWLYEEKPLPLQELFAVDHASPHYQEAKKASLFYTQSWALVHYLIRGDETGTRGKQLATYIRLLHSGADRQEAVTRAFGDVQLLERDFNTYVWFNPRGIYRIKVPPVAGEETFSTRLLSRSESAALRGQYLVRTGRPQLARALLEEALAADSDSAPAHEGMGFVHAFQRERTEAAESFEKALKIDPQRYLSHYYLASVTPGNEKEKHLQEAIAINPKFAPAYSELSRLYAAESSTLTQALTFSHRAVELEPDSATYFLNHGGLLLRAGRKKEAALAFGKRAAELSIATGSPFRGNNTCWFGSLAGLAEVVAPACEFAVRSEPENAAYRDSRGLARALLGDVSGALEDFRFFVESEHGRKNERDLTQRQTWIRELGAGRNPFDKGTLEELRGNFF